jgi:limonene-1,2-epoxide hydrolase
MKPAIGRAALRVAIIEWLHGAVGVRAVVRHQVSDGSIVMHERTDHFLLHGRETATPVGAAFEIVDGRIAAWREYFDMSPFVGGGSPGQPV